ncbi:MAG: DNA polymerase, partial [SAR202 cluster bacterium]|nr:DNA polymerase [SAR202 cluster bacterium]
RYIHEIDSSNYNVRAAGERMAINMPIQGTAADILKIAMIRIQDIIDQEHLESLMILQVHDELIFEVPSEELGTMRELIFEIMSSAMKLDVPLEVEMKSGYNWDDMD